MASIPFRKPWGAASPSSAAAGPGPELVVEPTRGWASLRLRELWPYRELLYFLVWRDVKVRYKQTVLGAGWAVLQPLVTMVVFSVIFGRFAGLPSDGVPYPIFTYAALLPWLYFAGALTRAGGSLVGNANLIGKVYFPRLVIPIAATLGGFVDFAVAFAILLGMLAFYGLRLSPAVVALPCFLLLALATALGAGLWLAALNVKYRDVSYLIPFLVTVWMYATPVAYSLSIVPVRLRFLYGLNPMAGVVEGFRWALLGTRVLSAGLLVASTAVAALLLVTGAYYFRRMERTFADVV